MSHYGKARWRQNGGLAVLGLLPVLGLFAADRAAAAQPHGVIDAALIQKYCAGCHNDEQWSGGLSLDGVETAHIGNDAEMWETVVRKVRTGMMPPAGEPRPQGGKLQAFAAGLERELDNAARGKSQPGHPGLRRLTRFEYGNVIRDLLGLQDNVTTLLPPDNNSDGFDTNGETLGNSPALIEAYVNAAAKLARRAVGDRQPAVVQVDYRPPTGWSQDRHIDSLPLGTRGGYSVRHEFPVDGDYDLVISVASGGLFGGTVTRGRQIYVALDKTPLTTQEADSRKYRVHVKAGPRTVTATLVDQVRSKGTDDIYSIDKLQGAVTDITITGPFNAAGAGDTPSRRKVFVCRPATTSDEEGCARRILSSLAAQAYRAPVSATDPAVDSLMGYYREARGAGDFEDGIEQALARLLVNPRFLFRLEQEPAGLAPGAVYRLPDVELASRLSFFLWSSIPDAELRDLASRGRLRDPKVLEKQVKRMLADPHSDALVTNFAGQWLRLRALDSIPADSQGFDENLRQSMLRETRLLLSSVMSGNRSIIELLNARYTFLDEPLARHYGVADVKGSYVRRVELPAGTRSGLLGQGSILTLTSLPERTSPVVRGKWIMESLIGAHVPAPPAGVETNLDPSPGHDQPTTLRQRLEMHRAQPQCAACHRIMDPVGVSLENFDRTGRWRTQDNGLPVDSRSELVDGTPLNGPDDLRAWLVSHPDVFATNLAQKLLIYALGRSVDHHDMPAVRGIVRAAAVDDYQFATLVLGVVQSQPFQYRNTSPAPTAPPSPPTARNR
ncbi:MAG: DUF1592 domain-containing protein [Steroidobacteraceae bacterium]